jgi:LPXTG-site transpeptidase (sortase) family protein
MRSDAKVRRPDASGVPCADRGGSGGRWRAAALVIAVAAIAVLAVACSSGKKKGSGTGTPGAGGTPTIEATGTAGANAGLKTPIAISPGNMLTKEDLAARGSGVPGRGDFNGARLVIPKVEIDAPFSDKVVPLDGQMPNPNSWDDVAYYDFSQFPDKGGLPGKGGNIVLAGHVDYIRHGPAVFWRLHELAAGDIVTIRLTDGSEINYKIEFNKVLDPNEADWSGIVSATADESVTLITCTGVFEAGHYNNRQVAWGRRV